MPANPRGWIPCVTLLALLFCNASGVKAQNILSSYWFNIPYNFNSAHRMAYSPSGTSIAVSANTNDAILELVNPQTGAIISAPNSASSYITGLAYTPDGKKLVDCGDLYPGAVIEMWSVATGTPIWSVVPSAAEYVYSVAVSPDGTRVADCAQLANGGVVEIRDSSSGALLSTLTSSSKYGPYAVAFSPDGKTLADAGQASVSAGAVDYWNVSTGSLISSFNPPGNPYPFCCRFSPDSKTLLLGGLGAVVNGQDVGALQLWQVATNSLLTSINTAATGGVMSVAFSPNGKMIADSGYRITGSLLDGVLELWNASTGKQISSVSVLSGSPGAGVAFSPDSTTLADVFPVYESVAGALQLWNVSAGVLQAAYTGAASGPIPSVAFSPDSTQFAAGDFDGSMQITNAGTGAAVENLSSTSGFVNSLAYSGGGTVLVDGGIGGVLQLLSVGTGASLGLLPTQASSTVSAVAASSDNTTLAVGGLGAGAVLELWNIASQTRTASLPTASTYPIAALAFSPDGMILASGGSNYNSSTGQQAGVLELWSVAAAQRNATLPTAVSGGIYSVSISADGTMLAVGGITGGAEIWSLASQTKLAAIATPSSAATTVAFCCDGVTLYVGCGYSLQAISLANFGQLASYTQGFAGKITALAVSPDGTKVGYGSQNGAIGVAKNNFFRQALLSSVVLSPASVTAGAQVTGTVTLTALAVPGGATVALTSANPSVSVPTTVTIPAGSNTATFTATTSQVAAPVRIVVTASYLTSAKTGSVVVYPQVNYSVAMKPASIIGGKTAILTVTLASPAPAGGLQFNIASSNPAVASFASNYVKIAAGQTSGTDSLFTKPVASATKISLSATIGLTTQSTPLTITP